MEPRKSALRMTFSSAILFWESRSSVKGTRLCWAASVSLNLRLPARSRRHAQIRQHLERIIGVGHVIQPGDAHRHAGPGLLERLAQIVIHLPDTAKSRAAQDHVPPAERPLAHQ